MIFNETNVLLFPADRSVIVDLNIVSDRYLVFFYVRNCDSVLINSAAICHSRVIETEGIGPLKLLVEPCLQVQDCLRIDR